VRQAPFRCRYSQVAILRIVSVSLGSASLEHAFFIGWNWLPIMRKVWTGTGPCCLGVSTSTSCRMSRSNPRDLVSTEINQRGGSRDPLPLDIHPPSRWPACVQSTSQAHAQGTFMQPVTQGQDMTPERQSSPYCLPTACSWQ
jgi:hypothetical protein